MKRILACILLLAASIFPARAQTYYDIDVDLGAFPEMHPIPDLPVYWAPGVDSNYFYYDGLFWDFFDDHWYASLWYNGPWEYVEPVYVPTYVLWVPINYYRKPAHYFHHWNGRGPPQWGQRWGRDWQAAHNHVYGNHNPASRTMAPLPAYQRNYQRGNYPRGQQQYALHAQNYNYQPSLAVSRQHYQRRAATVQRQAPTNPAARGEQQPALRVR